MSAQSSVRLPGDHAPIDGRVVSFRPVSEADLPSIMRLRSDSEVVKFWGEPPADEAAYRREFLEEGVSPVWRFLIESGGRDIGLIQYHHAYPGTGYEWSAGVDVFIGDPGARDGGVGTEVMRTMLQYLFETRAVHRVTIDPETGNPRAIRCYEKAGFHLDGVLPHNAFEHGEYVDTHFMSIREDEWPAAKARWEADAAG